MPVKHECFVVPRIRRVAALNKRGSARLAVSHQNGIISARWNNQSRRNHIKDTDAIGTGWRRDGIFCQADTRPHQTNRCETITNLQQTWSPQRRSVRVLDFAAWKKLRFPSPYSWRR